MDVLTLILVALASGAAVGARETASEAIKDAYHGLRDSIKRKFANRADTEQMLSEFERNPEAWMLPLRKALREALIDHDEEIVKAAERLLALTKPNQAVESKYSIQVTGNVKSIHQGDFSTVNTMFNDQTTKE